MPLGRQHRNIDVDISSSSGRIFLKGTFLLKDAKNFKLDVDLLAIVKCRKKKHNVSTTKASDVESHKNVIYFKLGLRDGWHKVFLLMMIFG